MALNVKKMRNDCSFYENNSTCSAKPIKPLKTRFANCKFINPQLSHLLLLREVKACLDIHDYICDCYRKHFFLLLYILSVFKIVLLSNGDHDLQYDGRGQYVSL